ncbi:YybH family protein [Halovulum sp. GXIMD14794]
MAIAEARAAFEAAFNGGDPAAVAAMHSEDGIVLAPGWKTTEGRDRIETMYTAFFKAGFSNLRSEEVSFEMAGNDMAVEVVHDQATRTDGNGDKTEHSYKVLRVWKKDADGAWLVHRESFNDLPGG